MNANAGNSITWKYVAGHNEGTHATGGAVSADGQKIIVVGNNLFTWVSVDR